MTAKDREAKREARKWAKAEKDALKGKADAGYIATHSPKKEQKRTKEGDGDG